MHRAILGLGNKGGRGCGGEKGGGDGEARQRPRGRRKTASHSTLSRLESRSHSPGGGRGRNKQPQGKDVAEKRAEGERETESVQADEQKGRCFEELGRGSGRLADPQVPSCPGARLGVRRVLAALGAPLRPPASPGLRYAGSGGEVRGERRRTADLRSERARGAALAELACPADAPARGVSHRGAALGGQDGAGQAGLVCRRARPSLAARAGPSSSAAHKPMARRPLPRAGLPRPRGGRGGHRGVGGEPRAAAEALPGAACGGRTHARPGDPLPGTPCRCAT